MNWEYVVTLFFALTFVFVIALTLGFYINYKRDQKNKKKVPEVNPINGRYFSRYIPTELHHMYQNHLEE